MNAIPMTERLNAAIGIIQKNTKRGEALIHEQIKACRRYAAKYGWDADYLNAAVEWSVVSAAKAIRAAASRHEPIAYPDNFVRYQLANALKRDRDGRVVLPRFRNEWRHGSGVEVWYSDTPMKKLPKVAPVLEEDFDASYEGEVEA